MSAIFKFDFKKKKKENKIRFSEVNYLNYTKKTQFACDNYIFPKTRGNKQRTCSTPLKCSYHKLYRVEACSLSFFN